MKLHVKAATPRLVFGIGFLIDVLVTGLPLPGAAVLISIERMEAIGETMELSKQLMTMQRTCAKIASLMASLAFAVPTHAALTFINMQIDGAAGPLSGTYGTGPGQYLAPVAYPGSTWNQASLSATDMTSSDGAATVIDFTLDITGKSSGGSGPADNPWMEALNGYRYKGIGPGDSPATITFSDLTSGISYDIHFILQGNNNEVWSRHDDEWL